MTAAHFRNAPEGARYVFDPDVPFGLPFRPTPFTATFNLSIESTPVDVTIPIQARSEGDIFSGEKRYEIHVVPAFAVIGDAGDRRRVHQRDRRRHEGCSRHRHQSCERRGERGRGAASCRKAGAPRRPRNRFASRVKTNR